MWLTHEIDCDYCNKNENEAPLDLKNNFIAFSDNIIKSGYNICKYCFNKLNLNDGYFTKSKINLKEKLIY